MTDTESARLEKLSEAVVVLAKLFTAAEMSSWNAPVASEPERRKGLLKLIENHALGMDPEWVNRLHTSIENSW